MIRNGWIRTRVGLGEVMGFGWRFGWDLEIYEPGRIWKGWIMNQVRM